MLWNNGRDAYYRCKGLDGLMARRRATPCHSRQVAADRLDALVWADLCAVLTDPGVLDEAVRRAQQGWLSHDERQARRQDLHRRRGEVERQIGRLVDAYAAEVLSLEELRARRTTLEERLAALGREEQQLLAEGVKDDQLQQVAGQVASFRARIDWMRSVAALVFGNLLSGGSVTCAVRSSPFTRGRLRDSPRFSFGS